MGYFTEACRYCNGDDPQCVCGCHHPSIYKMEARELNYCDVEER